MGNPVKNLAFATTIAFVAFLTACSKPVTEGPPAAAAGQPASESEKTQALEEKAQGYKDRFDEIQASDMTAEEKAQAAQTLVDEQQRTIQEADSSGGSGENPN